MIDNVTSLNPEGSIEAFFKRAFGERYGYVYCPITAPGDESDWQPYFFMWPADKPKLIEHITTKSQGHDVYFSPTLFDKPDLKREHVQGTKLIWAEFNGETPVEEFVKKIPTPSLKMRTSVNKHEVWFWELSFYNKDIPEVEEALKTVAFHIGADLSTWHHESVLRVPGTTNHTAGLATYLFDANANHYAIAKFQELPEAPKYVNEIAYAKLPPFDEVYGSRAWPIELIKFIKKSDPLANKDIPVEDKNKRTELRKAYVRLAFDLAEMGYDDMEMLSVLLEVDKKWKYVKQNTQEARRGKLIGIINQVRKYKPYHQLLEELEDDYKSLTYSYREFMEVEFNFEWLVEDLLPVAGLATLVADSETGKTRFSIALAFHLAMGRDFLKWKINRPIKVLFASLEQMGPDLKFTFKNLSTDLLDMSDEERKNLDLNFDVFAKGSSINLDKPRYQRIFQEFIEEMRPEIVIIDTLGVAVQDDIENAKIVNNVFDFINSKIRKKNNCAVMFIHHNRKHGDKKPSSDDMFGSVYIKNQMTMIIALERMVPLNIMRLKVKNAKNRLSPRFADFECIGIQSSAKYDLIGVGGVKVPKQTKPKEAVKKLVTGAFLDFDNDND